MRARLILAVVLLCAVAGAAAAADQRVLVRHLAADFIVPRYQALAAAAARQQAAWDGFCAAPSADGASGLDTAFHAAADAWSRIEFLRFGPISKDFRHERMAHWPERRNAVARALSGLLAWSEGDILTPDRFAETSVAGQGLTALERLLFDDGAKDKLLRGAEASRRCAVGRAIARSLAAVSDAVLREWTSGDGVLAGLAATDDAGGREALTRIATDLLSAYQSVGDLKIDAVMGRELGQARAALAEGRRSGRAARVLVLNLESVRDFTLAVPGTDKDQAVDALDLALRLARALPPDFAALADDPGQRSRLILMRDAVRSAQHLSAATVPPALGVTLGFNSLDGD